MKVFLLVSLLLLESGFFSLTASSFGDLEKEIGERLSWDSLYLELRPYVKQNSPKMVRATIGRTGSLFGFCSRVLNLCTVYKRYSYRNPEAQKSAECCGAVGEKAALLALMTRVSETTGVVSSGGTTSSGGLSGSTGLIGQPTSMPPGAAVPLRPDRQGSQEPPQFVETDIPFERTLPSPADYKSSASVDEVASLRGWTRSVMTSGLYSRAIVPCVKRSDPFAYVLFYPLDNVNAPSLVVGVYHDLEMGQWTTAQLIRTTAVNRHTARLELLFREGGCGVIYPPELQRPQ